MVTTEIGKRLLDECERTISILEQFTYFDGAPEDIRRLGFELYSRRTDMARGDPYGHSITNHSEILKDLMKHLKEIKDKEENNKKSNEEFLRR